MCPTRIEPKLQPIELDLTAAFSFEHGFGRSELLALGPQLETVRKLILASFAEAGDSPSAPKAQLLLDDYKINRKGSLLAKILSVAKQLRDSIDRAVILAPPPLVAAAQALFVACCHPHHNELTRGQRGGRPRAYFIPAAPDNDSLQGLLEILPRDRMLHTIDERWGIVAVTHSESTSNGADPLVTGIFGVLWDALQPTTTASGEKHLAAVVAPKVSALATIAQNIGVPQIAVEPSVRSIVDSSDESSGCGDALQFTALFHPGVLLAASVMSMDIVKLLRGAAAMADRFATEPPGNNPPLDLAGLYHLLALRRGISGCRIEPATAALVPLAKSFERGQSKLELHIQWLPQTVRHDQLRVTMPQGETTSGRQRYVTRSLVELAEERATTLRTARSAIGSPTAVVRLPVIDESSVGQLVELFSIADAIERILCKS